MAYDDNIYGVQKVPEPPVRDGWDMAMGTTAAAAQGAQIGAQFGPIGAGVGAVAGGALGFLGQERGKFNEERNLESAEVHNKFVETLADRGPRTTNLVRAQARNGMGNTGKYQMDVVEIEGDGSGDPINGIGEVHVDKNYNIKNMVPGAPSHEEGGVKIPAEVGDDYLKNKSLEKGDIIFPWQNDEVKYEKGMMMIKRYKQNGDPRAKAWLDKQADNLPTDEDYGYTDDKSPKKYQEGFKGNPKAWLRKQLRLAEKEGREFGIDRDAIKNMTKAEALEYMETSARGPKPEGAERTAFGNQMIGNRGNVPMTDTETAADLASTNGIDGNGNPVMINPTNTGGGNVTGNNNPAKTPKMQIIPGKTGKRWIEGTTEFVDMGDGWVMRKNHETGQLEAHNNNWPEDQWRDIQQEEDRGDINQSGTTAVTNYDATNQHYFGESRFEEIPDNIVEEAIVQKKPQPEPETTEVFGQVQTPPMTEPVEKAEFMEDVSPEEKVAEDTTKFMEKFRQRHRNDPMKYASAFNNLVQGTADAEKVTRRFYSPEELKYQDRSHSQRRAINENRNATAMMLRGKGLTAGQQQSYLGQAGAKALRAHEAVNEAEARRADQIDNFNVQSRNQAAVQNLHLAHQYDIEDAQNRAAKQKYFDQSMSDFSELAQVNEQAGYMRDKDARMMDIQEKTIPMIGTTDFGYRGNKWDDLQFRGQNTQIDPTAGLGDPVTGSGQTRIIGGIEHIFNPQTRQWVPK